MKTDRSADGALAVAKQCGGTSRRVVDRVGRILGLRRVGHAGTLDPFAEGVLIVLWGRATGLVNGLHEYPKTYEADVRFGRTTDTQDRTGEVLAEVDAAGLTRERIEAALPEFRGRITQIPPAYSAVKVDGRRAHDLARRGVPVNPAPRERTIHHLELTAWEPPVATLRVICETGTYVRTLGHDLGRALGVGASLDRLVRIAVGPWGLEHAVAEDRLETLDRNGLLAFARPPAETLPEHPAVTLEAADARAVTHGSWTDPQGRVTGERTHRLLAPGGRLLALARREERFRLERVFLTPEEL